MALVARNGLWLTRSEAPPPSLRTDGIVEAVASGKLTLSSLGDNVYLSSLTSNVVIGANGSAGVITVTSNQVIINADLQVLGTVDTIHTNDLHIADRLLNVASMSAVTDAPSATDGAGILVGCAALTDGAANERSIRWRAGLSPLSTDASATEPMQGGSSNAGCWDVRGGCLRITASVLGVPATGMPAREVSYGLRVNESDELEMFKRVLPSGSNETAASYRRVVCFGGAAAPSGALQLPTSRNPWVYSTVN